MSFIPARILSKLFNRTSLRNCGDKVCFSVKNRLAPATLLHVSRIELDGTDVPLDKVNVSCEDDPSMPLTSISGKKRLDFPLGRLLTFFMDIDALEPGKHKITVVFATEPFGELHMSVSDDLNTGEHAPGAVTLFWPQERALLTGDLIFRGGLGRADLPGGDGRKLKESIRRMATLDAEWLLPGHGDVISGAEAVRANFAGVERTWFDYI